MSGSRGSESPPAATTSVDAVTVPAEVSTSQRWPSASQAADSRAVRNRKRSRVPDRSAVRRLEIAFASRLAAPIAATVQLPEHADIDPVQARMLDRFSVLGILAARQAVRASRGAVDEGGSERGGSGVLVLPITYIFEEEPPRWPKLLNTLELER